MPAQNARKREELRRARVYTARVTVHEESVRRRRRDSIVAVVVFAVVVAAATFAQVAYFTAGPGKPRAVASATATATPTPTATLPAKSLSENRTWTGTLTLNSTVKLGISLDGKKAPQAVANFVTLAKKGFYTGLSCHRLTTAASGIFVLQCGDPNGDGSGGPGYSFGPIENAPKNSVYPAGTIAMANAGTATSQGSQFFIVYKSTTLPSTTGYTVFGTVTSGLSTLDSSIVSKGIVPAASTSTATANAAAGDGRPKVTTTITSLTVK